VTPTPESVRELLELEAKATPGRWRPGTGGEESCYHGPYAVIAKRGGSPFVLATMNTNFKLDDDAAFIAASRNALRPLAESWLELRDALARMEVVLMCEPLPSLHPAINSVAEIARAALVRR